jgi:ABC-2 type transport system ATP-binding protein
LPEILLRDVRKSYRSLRGRRTPVLEGVNLEIEAGEIFALLGPNGSGKTTLIKIVCTLLRPDSGEVRVAGLDALRWPREARGKIGCALDSDRGFFLRLSARENLLFFLALHGMSRRDARHLTAVTMGLEGFQSGERPVMEYSSGMRQKLAILRAILPDRPLLILDEPTRGLDPAAADSIRGQLRQEAERGKAVLLVTHDVAEAEELAGRAAILFQGRLHTLEGDWRGRLASEYQRITTES